MKTPEQLAEHYTKDWWANLPEAEGMRKSARENFLAGYRAAAPQWISVKDRLPEHEADVLTCCVIVISGKPVKCQKVIRFLGGIWDTSLPYAISHWQELPELPTEAE